MGGVGILSISDFFRPNKYSLMLIEGKGYGAHMGQGYFLHRATYVPSNFEEF